MNLRAKGCSRDKAVLEAIDARKCLDTEQLKVLLFPFKYGRRKAQERLLKLYKKGKVQRERVGEMYAYYRGTRPGMIKHTLGVNWACLWFEKCLKSWEKLHIWQYEQDYGILRCDGFAAVKNTVTGKMTFWFIEMDRGTTQFDKVRKYCRLYETEGYRGRWWLEFTDRFPSVLIVTTSPGRLEGIKTIIKDENTAGLRFDVRLLDDIKKEVLQKCGG